MQIIDNFLSKKDYDWCIENKERIVPSGLTDEGLPAGLQIVGPRFSEGLLVRMAEIVSKNIQITLPDLN